MNQILDFFKSKENKLDFLISIIVISLIGGLLFVLLPSTDSVDVPKVDIKKTVNADLSFELVKKNDAITKSKKMTTWIHHLEKQEIKNTTLVFEKDILKHKEVGGLEKSDSISTKPLARLSIEEEVPQIIIESIEREEVQSNTIDTIENSLKTIEETVPQVEIASKIVNKKPSIEYNKPKPIVNTPKKVINKGTKRAETITKCVVILGAFSNENNFKNLIDQVSEKYNKSQIYSGTRKGYKVVGIHVDCKNSESELTTLRRIYTKTAWLLELN